MKKLPEQWYLDTDILSSEEREIAQEYWKTIPGVRPDKYRNGIQGFLLSEDTAMDDSFMYWGDNHEFSKISFMQFKEFVLGKCPTPETVVNVFPIY